MKYANRLEKERLKLQNPTPQVRPIAPITPPPKQTPTKLDSAAQFFAYVLRQADPSIRLDGLKQEDVVAEGKKVLELAIAALKEDIARYERADSISSGDDRYFVVPLSALAAIGADHSRFEYYDSNPRMDTASPTKRVMQWNGLKIGITHEAGQDYRFGQKVGVSYGRLYGSYGDAADGKAHDFLVGEDLDNPQVFALQQLTPEGLKDEVKYGIGFNSALEFKQAYQAELPPKLKDSMFGGVWEVDPAEFDKYRVSGGDRQDSEEDAPNYRFGDGDQICIDCIHSRVGGPGEDAWINCDKFNFEVDPGGVCDDYEWDEDEVEGDRQDSEGSSYYMVWFAGRNTSTVVRASSRSEAIAKARAKKVAGHDQPVKSVKKAKGKDLDDIKKGKWVRTRPSGQRVHGRAPKEESPSRFRPQYKKDGEESGESEGDRQDAEDEFDIAIELEKKSEKALSSVFNAWNKQILSVIQSSGSLESASKAVVSGDTYDSLGDGKFIATLSQILILSHLVGVDEIANEDKRDSVREDAKLPEWLKLPFTRAIALFKKKVPIPTASYKKMEEGYHDWAFSIAKMTKASLLDDAKWVIQKGMEQGTSYDDMIKQWNRLIGRKGWQVGGDRIYTILDTNIRSAQASGRAEQMYDPEVIDSRPYAIWRHRDSPQFRPHHKALHNKAIALNDPFWDKVHLPASWGCRCSVFSASKDFCDRNGIEILKNPPDPTSIADEGFRYPLRGLSDDNRRKIIKQTLDALPEPLRKKVEADVNQGRN